MNKDTRQWEKAQEGRELENRCWEYLKPSLGALRWIGLGVFLGKPLLSRRRVD